MICINHEACNSKECKHRLPHPHNEFCSDGCCKWAMDTRCIPLTKEEKRATLEGILLLHFNAEAMMELADQIEAIYKEE